MTKSELAAAQATGSVTVVDIREAIELMMQPPLPGSVHIPMSQLVAAEAAGQLPKETKIVTVCATGSRCLPVTDFLRQQGYDADYLEGGVYGIS